jgi:L-methionine (R)-S-oxide reductase
MLGRIVLLVGAVGQDIYNEMIEEFELLAANSPTAEFLMQNLANRLRQAIVRFNWVAFYMGDTKNRTMLLLGPYSGMDTPNARISFNEGICGAVASSGKTIVVQSVKDDPRYLPDSEYTKSEIVLPIVVHGKVVGEIDINSFFESAFNDPMREFLERCATLVGRYLERQPRQ